VVVVCVVVVPVVSVAEVVLTEVLVRLVDETVLVAIPGQMYWSSACPTVSSPV
jgi:hypothetical protein